MTTMNLYPIDWKLMYDDNRAYAVCINEQQEKVGLHVSNIDLSIYVKIDKEFLKDNNFIKDFKSNFNIYKIQVQNRYSLIYYNENMELYTKLYFHTLKDFYNFRSTILKNRGNCGILSNRKNVKIQIFEDSISFILKILTKKEIRFGEWIEVKNFRLCKLTINKNNWKEYEVNESDILKSSCNIIPLMKKKIISFDIECFSDDDKKFPNALEFDHIIMMISVVIKNYNFDESSKEKHIFSCTKLNKMQGVIQHLFDKEMDMLFSFIKFITTQGADFIIGYNIWNFDFKYIDTRLENYDIKWEEVTDCNYNDLSFMKYIKNPDSENILITSANYLSILGTICIDLYPVMRRTTKLDSYKLDNVCNVYLNRGKLDVHFTEIFRSYREQDIELLTTVAEYAVEDSNLVLDLFDKTNVFVNLLESSKIYNIPIVDVVAKGQSIRVESQVYYIAYHNYYVMETGIKADTKFEGAVVQDPIFGFHENILTFDFASLYPSIIRAYNLCYTTILREEDKQRIRNEDKNEFNININEDKHKNNDDSEDSSSEEETIKNPIKEKVYHNVSFVKSNVRKGLLPILLENLVNQRKAVKAELEKETDPIKIRLLDAKQNAIKSSANSVYGILGSKFGRMGMVDIAKTITFQGRELITTCANYLREKYKAKIVYGDSVTPDTPVLIMKDNKPQILFICDLDFNLKWKEYEVFKENDTVESNRKDKFKIDLSDKNIYSWTNKGWSKIKYLIKHKCNKPIYRVKTRTSIVDVTSDHSLITNDGKLIKPSECMNKKLLHSFPENYNPQDFNLVEQIRNRNITKKGDYFYCDDPLITQKFMCYLKYIGYNPSISYEGFSYKIYQHSDNYNNEVEEVKIIKYFYDGFVYDIETEEGVFQAGIGDIIVKNTDSIMVDFNIKEAKDTTEIGNKISKELTSLFPPPLQIEFEKCYVKYFLVSKKRYAGYKYKENGNHIFDIKGLASTRRDSFPYFKKTFNDVIFSIMDGKSYDEIIEYIFDKMYKLLTRQIPIEELIMSGEVAKTYKNTSNCPMKLFVDNMKKNGIIIEPGQRISFVYVKDDFRYIIEKDKIIRDRTKRKDGNFMRMYEVYKNSKDPEPIDYEIYISKMANALDKLVDIAFNNGKDVHGYLDNWISHRLKTYKPSHYYCVKTLNKEKIINTNMKYFELQFIPYLNYKREYLHVDLFKYFKDKSENRKPPKQIKITDYLLNLHAMIERKCENDEDDETYDL